MKKLITEFNAHFKFGGVQRIGLIETWQLLLVAFFSELTRNPKVAQMCQIRSPGILFVFHLFARPSSIKQGRTL